MPRASHAPPRSLRWPLVAVALAVAAGGALAVACGSSDVGSVFDAGGTCANGAAPPCDASASGSSSSGGFDAGSSSGVIGEGGTPGVLTAIVRDFRKYDPQNATTNPDFENIPSYDVVPPGRQPAGDGKYYGPWVEASPAFWTDAEFKVDLVATALGADGVPAYNPVAADAGKTGTTHGKTAFDQWYRDVPGVNVARRVPLTLTRDANGVYSYDSKVSGVPLDPAKPGENKNFFPIDDGTSFATDFGNEGNAHNYHFTVELRTTFRYRGTETFKFSGDDDVFVFIAKQLVINIGGIHGALEKEVRLPDVAQALGLEVGKEYALDFFQAERHVTESNLRIDTTLELQAAPSPR